MIRELLSNSSKEGEEIRRNILIQAEKESQELLKQSQRKGKKIQSEAQEEIKKSIVENALLLTEKILKQEISAKNQQKLIDEFIDNLNEQ